MFNSIPYFILCHSFSSYSISKDASNEGKMYLDLLPAEHPCPHCHCRMHIYDKASTTLVDAPLFAGEPLRIHISLHRYRCPQCGETVTQSIPDQYPGTRITTRAAQWIMHFLGQHYSISAISNTLQINWGTIRKVQKDYMEKALDTRQEELKSRNYRPKFLAVDEFAIHKGHTYATCVIDLESGEALWVGRGRALKDFIHFFEEIPKEYLSEVQAVAMDMNASFNRLFAQFLPNAAIVYDRFHMQAQFGREVLGAVRLEEAREHKETAENLKRAVSHISDKKSIDELKVLIRQETSKYHTLKKSRWTLLTGSENLSEEKGQELEAILASHEKLAICYAMKEEMTNLFKLRNVEEARKGWEAWFKAARDSGIGPLMKFAKNKEKRIEGLIAHAVYPISTGKLEGFNNKIKVVKRVAFGYRDDDYFFKLIRFMSIPAISN